jgi:hypothetical protein
MAIVSRKTTFLAKKTHGDSIYPPSKKNGERKISTKKKFLNFFVTRMFLNKWQLFLQKKFKNLATTG